MDEFDLVLSKAANAINDRPLSVRKHGGAEDEVCPITPNLLMLNCRTYAGQLDKDWLSKKHDKALARMKMVEEAYQEWWVE